MPPRLRRNKTAGVADSGSNSHAPPTVSETRRAAAMLSRRTGADEPPNPEGGVRLAERLGPARLIQAWQNSLRGLRDGFSEASITQAAAALALALPVSVLVAESAWMWLALVGSLMLVLMVELLNTAIEKLCNHVTPERHDAIRATKDLASAAVLLAIALAALVWAVAIFDRLGPAA